MCVSAQITLVDFSPEHAVNYNELVEVSKRNFLTSDWDDENHDEHLLNTNNSKFSRERLNNLRSVVNMVSNFWLAMVGFC